MREIHPPLSQVKRTEPKSWNTPKVVRLLDLLSQGETNFLREPVYLTPDPHQAGYLVYNGNTRIFLAENDRISLDHFCLIETDADLEEVRDKSQEVYWPGNDLASVINYIRAQSEIVFHRLNVRPELQPNY